MNAIQQEVFDCLKGMGIIGVLRLLWLGMTKGWSFMQARMKQAVEVRRVEVEETRLSMEQDRARAEQGRAGADHAVGLITAMEARIAHQDTRQDTLETKIERLSEQVETEAEQSRIAWLSVEAAHLRADEADKARESADRARDAALAEMRRLEAANEELERRLREVTALRAGDLELRAKDQVTIQDLQAQMEANAQRIIELQTALDRFEHQSYLLTPTDGEETKP
jgi:predicted NUDIX family NTP pyrophosphohydrolase